jgi:hypothetical protein
MSQADDYPYQPPRQPDLAAPVEQNYAACDSSIRSMNLAVFFLALFVSALAVISFLQFAAGWQLHRDSGNAEVYFLATLIW